MKKIIILLLFLSFSILLTACNTNEFDTKASIKVYTRDTTSGTRDGFFSVIDFSEAKGSNNVLADGYIETASNGEMVTSIRNDEHGIGYISLSSLNSSDLKKINYNNIEPTEANVVNESYQLKRSFNYIIREDSTYLTTDIEQIIKAFVAYMNTYEGKSTIIGAGGIVDLTASDPTWNSIKDSYPICDKDNRQVIIKFGGSTSVEKVAKALSADFSIKCGNFVAEHNHTGSSDAYKFTQGSQKNESGKLDIGFASREFKDTEAGIINTFGKICDDAIVIVVNKKNTELTNIIQADIKYIYDGTKRKWSDIIIS